MQKMIRLIVLILLCIVSPVLAQQPDGFAVVAYTGIAPSSVFVNATQMTNRFDPMKCTFYWNFGDPAGRRNDLIGFNAAHTYDRAGDYEITLWVVDEKYSVTTFHMPVHITLDTRKTIFVSASGNDTNDGSMDRPLRSFNKALSIAQSDTRISLNRGDEFDVPRSPKQMGSNVVIGAYGDEKKAKPVVKYSGSEPISHLIRANENTLGLLVENITFDSIQNNNTDKMGCPDTIVAAGQNITVRDCTFLNVNYGFNGNGYPRGAMIIGCDAPLETGVRSYFAWIQGRDYVILDNSVANATREHVCRASGYENVLICGNNFTNIARQSIDPYDIAKGTITMQMGKYLYIRENTFNGPSACGPLGKKDGMKISRGRTEYVVVENNVFNKDSFSFYHGLEHAIFRNNGLNINDDRAMEVDGYSTEYDRICRDLTIAGNVAINRGTTGSFISVAGKVDGMVLTGNTYIAPNLEPGKNHTAGVYVTGSDLSSFTSISNNTWPITKPLPYARGGCMYIWTMWSDPQGYISSMDWNKLPQVSGDQFKMIEIPATNPAK